MKLFHFRYNSEKGSTTVVIDAVHVYGWFTIVPDGRRSQINTKLSRFLYAVSENV